MPTTSNTALTLNRRQSRALSIVQPGTVLLAGTDGPEQSPFFITASDDEARSGIWGLTVAADGDVILHLTGNGEERLTYEEILQEERERLEEERAEEMFGA